MSHRCVGRRTAAADVVFENGPRLHKSKPLLFLLPRRCSTNVNAHHTLCQECDERRVATEKQLVKRAGKYIPNQASMLHGMIHEDIPKWSRIYRGPWWQEQIQKGYTLSEYVRAEADEAYRLAKEEDPPIDMPPKKSAEGVKSPAAAKKEVVPTLEPVKKRVIKKKVSAPVPTLEPVVPTLEPVVPTLEPVVPTLEAVIQESSAPPPKKSRPKKTKKDPETPLMEPLATMLHSTSGFMNREDLVKTLPKKGIICPTKDPIEPLIKTISVRPMEIDGRSLYLGPNDKVFDTKFHYIGRYDEGTIDTTYPDSDA
jgi:hypothetical protein